MADIKEISEFLQKGRAKNVKALVAEALEEGQDPKVILNDGLLAGMMVIGEKFKNNEVFVPEVLVAARALNAGLTILEPKLIEVGKMYHLNGWQQFTKIYLPSALPSIFVGLKLGLSVSWMAVVGAEMIAATSGIGFRINDARSLMQYPVVFAGIIAIAVVGVIMDLAISLIGKLCTPWEKGR